MSVPSPDGATAPVAPVVVRAAATGAELDAAGAVVLAAYEADELGHPSYRATLLDARTRARDAEIAVSVDAGQVVGSVTFTTPGSRWAELSRAGEAEFRMLGVLPRARGLGVGTALVDWCLDRARALDCHRVVISSATTMRRAQHLYAVRGFVRRPELDWSPMPGVELIAYSIDL